MNKMAIIAGEIATGPGLGSSSVIINKIRQPRTPAPPRRACRDRRTAPHRAAPHRTAPRCATPHSFRHLTCISLLTAFRAQYCIIVPIWTFIHTRSKFCYEYKLTH